ncbi:hypothetical protein PVAND_006907 [Polypedilum vanderplanki]|uniref:Uncharacterized protein n=1 Tax=Polypedilum vanderplanki TaxID=319348 RepID=A0A9J6C5E4_POLVA|nr:hypothetical protein PVAND_006907 [Polypedilum vanderplanki]
MSTASPENQQQIQLQTESNIIHKIAAPSSPPELATMTNVVNVLDLHKGDFQNETKIYDKNTNTVYVYSNAPPSTKIDESTVASPESAMHHHHQQQLPTSEQQQQQMHQVIINQHPSDLSIDNALKDEHFELMQETNGVMLQRIVNDHIAEGRLVHHAITDVRGSGSNNNSEQILTKISTSDDSLFRLIETNQLVSKLVGENQQIISRDIINGEHHIITRNENGEHILTRIVNTAVDQQGKMVNGDLFNALGAATTTTTGTKIIDDGKTQIIYTTAHDAATTNGGVIKAPQPYDNLNSDVQKQIDLIYEDGNKTVIYTTASGATHSSSNPDSPHDEVEQKGLELFSATGECLNGTQVIVQGNLQYTPQIQPDGTTVYVVSELVSSDLNG